MQKNKEKFMESLKGSKTGHSLQLAKRVEDMELSFEQFLVLSQSFDKEIREERRKIADELGRTGTKRSQFIARYGSVSSARNFYKSLVRCDVVKEPITNFLEI